MENREESETNLPPTEQTSPASPPAEGTSLSARLAKAKTEREKFAKTPDGQMITAFRPEIESEQDKALREALNLPTTSPTSRLGELKKEGPQK